MKSLSGGKKLFVDASYDVYTKEVPGARSITNPMSDDFQDPGALNGVSLSTVGSARFYDAASAGNSFFSASGAAVRL